MTEDPTTPQPDPALRQLDRFVGRWSMEGNMVGSDEKNIKARRRFAGCRAVSSWSSTCS
jgi:hypothetical protein